MKRFSIELQGTTALLHHRMPQEDLFALLGAKSEKKKAQEERTPREIADRHAYKAEDGSYYIPTEYVVGAFKHVAGDYKQKNSARKSIKTVAAGIFRPCTETASLLGEDDKPLKSFEVDIRKATNHQKGAIAVCRPRFDKWKVRMEVMVDDTVLAPSIAHDILADSGKRAGIGSFRVQRGGYFGQFNVTKWEELD